MKAQKRCSSVKDLLCSPSFLQTLTPTERSELLRPSSTGEQQLLLARRRHCNTWDAAWLTELCILVTEDFLLILQGQTVHSTQQRSLQHAAEQVPGAFP
jgi:hypothetical protein